MDISSWHGTKLSKGTTSPFYLYHLLQ